MKKKSWSPAKKWLLLLGVLCIGFLAYDFMGSYDWSFRGDNLEALSDSDLNTADVPPEPEGQEQESNAEVPSNGDYYMQHQIEKERARGQEMELLNGIVDNPNSPESGKQQAQEKIIALAQKIEDEMLIAALLAAKDFTPSAAFIQDNQVTVVVRGELNENEAQQIADLVDGVTGIGMGNVVIIDK